MKETIEITMYDYKKGYGFAVSANYEHAGMDIFVHFTSFISKKHEAQAMPGKRYMADVKLNDKGCQAYNIEE